MHSMFMVRPLDPKFSPCIPVLHQLQQFIRVTCCELANVVDVVGVRSPSSGAAMSLLTYSKEKYHTILTLTLTCRCKGATMFHRKFDDINNEFLE